MPGPDAQQLKALWEDKAVLVGRPTSDIIIYEDDIRMLVQSVEPGPPVGYAPALRPNGDINHGYKPIKQMPALIDEIPELDGWPEFRTLILAINRVDGPTETLGCEKGFFPCDQGAAKVYVGSYVDIAFSDLDRNTSDEHLALAASIFEAMEGANDWWGRVEVAIQPVSLSERHVGRWDTMLKLANYGRDEEEARRFWAYSAGLITEVFGRLT